MKGFKEKVKGGTKKVGESMKKATFHSKDNEFIELEKKFESKEKVVSHLSSKIRSFEKSCSEIIEEQKNLALELNKIGLGTNVESLCKQEIETCNLMSNYKETVFDKQLKEGFVDPVSNYESQYKEIKERIQQRHDREYQVHHLTEKVEQYKHKASPKLEATETKLAATKISFAELDAELKRDIPALLTEVETFFEPVISLLILNQYNFWSSMSQFTCDLSQKLKIKNTTLPPVKQYITPKEQSSYRKKGSESPVPPASPRGTAAAPPASPRGTAAPPPTDAPPASPRAYVPPPMDLPTAPPLAYPPPSSSVPPPMYAPTAPPLAYPPSSPVPPPMDTPAPLSTSSRNAPPSPRTLTVSGGRPTQSPRAQPVPVFPPPQAQTGPAPTEGFQTTAPPAPLVVTPPTKEVRALWDYNGQNEHELSFRVGDIIVLLSQQGEWWSGQLNGKTGFFPGNYVAII